MPHQYDNTPIQRRETLKDEAEDILNQIPEELLPKPEPEPDLEADLERAAEPAVAEAMRKRERGLARLMGQRLFKERDQMREFLSLGLESAIIRASSKRRALAKRTRFYFARKQEQVLANEALKREDSNALDRAAQADALYKIVFSIEQDDNGFYIRLGLDKAEELQPDPKA